MSSVALYRSLVPAHGHVPDDVVDTWLALAARRHTATRFGNLYPEAMVWWVAAELDPEVQAGLYGVSSGATCTDGLTSTEVSDTLTERPYRRRYLDIRNSRAAGTPMRVAP